MQAACDEMKRRIEALERHIKHCEGDREELLAQVAKLDRLIEEDKNLAVDYREVLRRAAVAVSPHFDADQYVAKVDRAWGRGE